MVYYFECPSHPEFKVYMGRDKFENEDLIRYGWPEDVWFHVEHLSSAHVYVRCPQEHRKSEWDQLPEEVLYDMCQLVKQNSIEGSKKDTVEIVYTPWSNLKKTGNMDIGQVGFSDEKLVRRIKKISKDRNVVKRLEKSRTEASPNLEKEKADRDRQEINRLRKEQKDRRTAERELMKAREEERAMKSYESLQKRKELDDEIKGDGTIESCRAIEDDFM